MKNENYYEVPRDVVTVEGKTIAGMYIGWSPLEGVPFVSYEILAVTRMRRSGKCKLLKCACTTMLSMNLPSVARFWNKSEGTFDISGFVESTRGVLPDIVRDTWLLGNDNVFTLVAGPWEIGKTMTDDEVKERYSNIVFFDLQTADGRAEFEGVLPERYQPEPTVVNEWAANHTAYNKVLETA